MIFHTPQKRVVPLQLKIDSADIDRVKDFNFLGLVVNENLNWKSHTENVSNNMSKTIDILNRLKHVVALDIKITLYNSLILSHINYCLLIWGYERCQIFKLQKKAIRIVSISKYNAHTESIFKKLKLLKLEDILKLQELKFFFKYSQNKLPHYFCTHSNDNHQTDNENFILNLKSNIHTHNTRNKNKLHRAHVKHSYAKKCLRHSFPKTIETTPNLEMDKIHTHSLQVFIKYAKNIFIQKYNENYDIQNCYICKRHQTT